MKPKIGIVGAGRVGQAFGKALASCGWEIEWVASRAPRTASQALLIAVSDDAVAAVASSLAESCPSQPGVVLHTSGAHGPEILRPLAAKGWGCGMLHPLQTISVDAPADIFQGIGFAISGDERALAFGEQIIASLGGTALPIRPDRTAMYHAAAVMSSNYVAALMHSAERLLQLAGLTEAQARGGLAPLIRQSVENCIREGPAQALTGPIRRGDTGTVAAHLAALASGPESIANLYRALGTYTLEVARESGLPGDRASQIEKLF